MAVKKARKKDVEKINQMEQISEKRMKTLLKKRLRNKNMKNRLENKKIPIISRNMYHNKRYHKEYNFKKDLKILNKGELSIITRLRTEHIQLNFYYHKRTHYK